MAEDPRAWEASEALPKLGWDVLASSLTIVIDHIQGKPLDHPDRIHLESLSQVRNLAKRSTHEQGE